MSAIGRLEKPQVAQIPQGESIPPENARRGARKVNFDGTAALDALVYDRSKLLSGNIVHGPAIIEEVASTTVIEPGDKVTVNEFGHLVMTLVG